MIAIRVRKLFIGLVLAVVAIAGIAAAPPAAAVFPAGAFVTTWDTTKVSPDNRSIVLPLDPWDTSGAYDFTVDWGDGTPPEHITISRADHEYTSPGSYRVIITGNLASWNFGITGVSKDAITNIEQWGPVHLGLMRGSGYFAGARNLDITATDTPDLTGVTDLSNMFEGCTSLRGATANWNWNTGQVRGMSGMFAGAEAFNQPIGSWDTGQVTRMDGMFAGAAAFDQPLNTWDTGRVLDMSGMFSGAAAFDQPLNDWNTGQVRGMSDMFAGAEAFNQPIGSWDTGQVTRMDGMFAALKGWYLASSVFNQPIGGWDTSQVTDMSQMFYLAKDFNQDISGWDTGQVTTMDSMFWGSKLFNQPIGGWDTSQVTNMHDMFSGAKVFNQDIGAWDTSQVTTMDGMFSGATVFNQPLNEWDTTRVTRMDGMFGGATAFNQPVGSWNTSQVTAMNGMFRNAVAFNQPIGSWDTSQVTTMDGMFSGATVFNQPLNNWETGQVTNMWGMFSDATVFNQPLNEWDTSRVTWMGGMFSRAVAFDRDLGSWNVGSLERATSMFSGAELSTANYDKLLIGWAAQTVRPRVDFSAGDSRYSQAAAAARATLHGAPNYWSIDDRGEQGVAVSIHPSPVAFGEQQVGSSLGRTVTVTSTGSEALVFGPSAVTLDNPTDFALAEDYCSGQTLTREDSCTVEVIFAPTSAGNKSATLFFADNSPSSPRSVAVTGTGTAVPTPTPTPTATPTEGPTPNPTATASPAPTATVSPTAPAPTGTPPRTPAAVKGVATAGKVRSSWKPAAGATGYTATLTGKDRKGRKVTRAKSTSKPAATFSVQLKRRSTVKVCVAARNAAGSSAPACTKTKVG